MAERVTKVRLSAVVNDYVEGMEKARKKTLELGDANEKLAQQKQAMDLMGKSLLGVGAALTAGFGLAVAKASDFNQAMSYVKATGADAVENFTDLRQAALDAGAATVFSATESANAIEEMAKAGVDAKDILGGGLDGALDLAAAGGLGVADAAGIAAVALKTFKLEGSDMGHVADLLAAGAGKAMGDVSDLSQALAQGGQVAAATGLSIEETTAALSAFASQGLLGSDAGTSLKTMLQRLTPQSKEAADKFKELGISAYDANGQFVGLANFSGQLKERMKDLTPEARNAAMAVMFGSDAVRAANVLYTEGEAGIRDWIKAVDDQGYAAETAKTRLDNLRGDIEALGGAFDTLLITMGDSADGPLRALVQWLTELVDGFNELPGPIKVVLEGIGLTGAAAAVAGGAFLLAVPKVVAFKEAMTVLGMSTGKTMGAMRAMGTFMTGPWGVAIAGLAIGLKVANDAMNSLQATTEEMKNAAVNAKSAEDILSTAFQGIADGMNFLDNSGAKTRDSFQKNLDIIGEIQENWWARFSHGFDSHGSLRDALDNVDDALADLAGSGNMAEAQRAFQILAKETDGSEEQLMILLKSMDGFKGALLEQATAAKQAGDDQSLLKMAMSETVRPTEATAEAIEQLQQITESAQVDINALADQIRNFGSATLDTRSAQRQFEQAVDDLTASLEKNGTTLDINEQAGRDNQAALDDLAKSALDVAASIAIQTGDQEAATQALAEGRQKLIEQLEQFGITGQAAQDYADSLGLIPGQIATAVQLQTDEAQAAVDRFMDLNNGKTLMLYAGLNIEDPAGRYYDGGMVQAFADGGFPSGVYKGVQGGIHKFAEAEMGVPWEAYISGRPSSRDRNVGVWMDAGQKLGVLGTGGGGKTVNVNQTFVLPQGMTPADVERISAERAATAVGSA